VNEFIHNTHPISTMTHEEIYIVAVDGQLVPLGVAKVGQGGSTGAATDTSTALRAAIISGARGVFLIHNHPGGSPTPSQEDLMMTKKVKSACEAADLRFFDHVIVTPDKTIFASFQERGLL